MRFALFLLLIVGVPTVASAERYQTTWYGFVTGGVSVPSDPATFKDRYKPGFSGGLGFGLQMSPWVTVLAHADADFFSLDQKAVRTELNLDSIEGGNLSVVHAFLAARAHVTYPEPHVRFLPYLLATIGVIRTRTGNAKGTQGTMTLEQVTETDIHFATSVGFGIDWQTTERIRIFTDVQGALAFADPDDFIYFPIRFGLSVKLGGGPSLR